jgi:hypothetical protein
MTDKSTLWEKENIRLYENEAADREFARVKSECASDSDLLRQALRNAEQLVDDTDHQRTLQVRRLDGSVIQLLPELFQKDRTPDALMVRRSLILHKTSKQRINNLQKRLGLEDISAVARFALRFFSRIVREATAGAQFFIVDAKGGQTEVRFGAFTSSKNEIEQSPLPQPGGVLALPTRPPDASSKAAVPRRLSRHATLRVE